MKTINYFKALADETRLRLFNILLNYELSVNEIVTLMNMGQSRISRHLKILTDSSLVECRRDGVWAFYSAAKSGIEERFNDSIRFLFKEETVYKGDLNRASNIIEERKRESKQFFNAIAPRWDQLKNLITGDFDVNKTILENAEKSEFAVDLGCGTGEFLKHLGKKAQYCVGIDSSSKMLEEARKHFKEDSNKINLRLGELEHLPVGDGEADLAVMSMVLHHLPEPVKAISEASRILKKNGVFIITDFGKHNNESMRKIYGDRWLGFSKKEIETILNNNGFILENIKSYDLQQSLKLNIFKSKKEIYK
ncbi:MAG: metalloregulator ArsR/SmtB family transcription factor [Desulfobacterales bacterium]|nr:metalloregulator ArsR/SmtB family transcription factor [Desulfobacterales bacterium]